MLRFKIFDIHHKINSNPRRKRVVASPSADTVLRSAAEEPDMILIKRYGNRRLYDMSRSSYIKLPDVADMVRRGEHFKVVDAKSGKDLTRRVLTQILVEDARQGPGGPPLEFLRHLILASDPEMKDFLNWYLAQALDAYERMKHDWQQGRATPPVPPAPSRARGGSPDESLADEMRELRRRMEEMEQRFGGS